MMSSFKFRAIALSLVLVVISGGFAADPSAGPEKVLLAGNLTGPQHLGIPVTDIARSKEFYERLGFREVMSAELPEGKESVKVAMMDFDGFVIELYQLTGKDQPGIRARGDGHIDHIALNVRDIGKAFHELKAAGLTIVEKEPVFLPFWEKGIKYFNLLGPDGERVEFSEKLR
jgi:catechol 2,3-dioxygenase-like lactoylglutathione lyase family enzyme